MKPPRERKPRKRRDYVAEKRKAAERNGLNYVAAEEREAAKYAAKCLPETLARHIQRRLPQARAAKRRAIELRAKPWLSTDDLAERERIRLRLDPDFALRRRVHRQLTKQRRGQRTADLLRAALKREGTTSVAVFGYSIPELRRHLERQFSRGMTWAKFCAGEIHIDHIRPLASFDLSDPERVIEAWSLPNLRPMWAGHNRRKGAAVEFLL